MVMPWSCRGHAMVMPWSCPVPGGGVVASVTSRHLKATRRSLRLTSLLKWQFKVDDATKRGSVGCGGTFRHSKVIPQKGTSRSDGKYSPRRTCVDRISGPPSLVLIAARGGPWWGQKLQSSMNKCGSSRRIVTRSPKQIQYMVSYIVSYIVRNIGRHC